MSEWLPEWALAEFATFYAEADLNRLPNVKIVRNAKLRPRSGKGRSRQVDVALTYRYAGIELVHIVEVEARGGRWGSEALDQLKGKASELGASAATAVSTSGFTKPALERIATATESLRLRAIELRPPKASEVPEEVLSFVGRIQSRDDTRDADLESVELVPLVYFDAVTNQTEALIAIALVERDKSEYVIALGITAPFTPPYNVSMRAITKAGSKKQLTRFSVTGPGGSWTHQVDPRNGKVRVRYVRNGPGGDPGPIEPATDGGC